VIAVLVDIFCAKAVNAVAFGWNDFAGTRDEQAILGAARI
jgi:hypothetical protein